MHPTVAIFVSDPAIAGEVRALLDPDWSICDGAGEADLVVVGPGNESRAEPATGAVAALGATPRAGWIALDAGAHERLAQIAATVQATCRRNRQDQHDLCAALAHDLRNPLGAALANAGFLADELASAEPDVVEATGELADSLRRVDRLVGDLLTLTTAASRGLHPALATTPASSVFGEVLRLCAPSAKAREVRVRAVATTEHVQGDAGLLARALGALVAAALRECRRDATVEIALANAATSTTLAVRHDGRALSEQPRALALGEGHSRPAAIGLALALAQAIARSHGGHLEAGTSADWPTELRLVLPR